MMPRLITPRVRSALDRQAAVALIGPRQVGKTTLALDIARTRDSLYLDLEDRDDRSRLAEPALFFDHVEDRLVILDEIHGCRTSSRHCAGGHRQGAPKIYVRDSGLVHALLGIASLEQLAGHPVVGASWEGWVIETLLASLPPRSTPGFYRTSAGAEIDLVIEHAGGTLWAVEIKRSLSARVSRGFHVACRDLKPERAFVVHAGDERYPVSRSIEAISVRELATDVYARS